jgi:hypothetical protein
LDPYFFQVILLQRTFIIFDRSQKKPTTEFFNGLSLDERWVTKAREALQAIVYRDSDAYYFEFPYSSTDVIKKAQEYLFALGVDFRLIPSMVQKDITSQDNHQAIEILPSKDTDLGRLALAMDQSAQNRKKDKTKNKKLKHQTHLVYDPIYLDTIRAGGFFNGGLKTLFMGHETFLKGKFSKDIIGLHELVHFKTYMDQIHARPNPFLAWFHLDPILKQKIRRGSNQALYGNEWSFDEILAYQKSVQVALQNEDFNGAVAAIDTGKEITQNTIRILVGLLDDPSNSKEKKGGCLLTKSINALEFIRRFQDWEKLFFIFQVTAFWIRILELKS